MRATGPENVVPRPDRRPGGPKASIPALQAGPGIAIPLRVLGRAAVSLALLVALGAVLDVGRVAARLGRMQPGWVGLALAVSVVQVGLSAWRWRFTARRLGLRLDFREALSEYYLATFLNQVLPGGVAGDLSRAWRHGRVHTRAARGAQAGPPPRDAGASAFLPDGRAVRAVLLERASGQAVMLVLAAVSVAWLPLPGAVGRRLALAAGVLACGAVAAVAAWLRWRPRADSLAGRLWNDTRAALLSRRAAPPQLVSSSLVVATYVTVYVLAARAVGVDVPLATLLPLVAPVLVSMLVPVTIAGWGIREGSAALVWSAVLLPAADGVAVSMAYGLLVLLSSLPGAVILLTAQSSSRS